MTTRPFGSVVPERSDGWHPGIFNPTSPDIPEHIIWASNSQVGLPFSEGYINLTSAGDLLQRSPGFFNILCTGGSTSWFCSDNFILAICFLLDSNNVGMKSEIK